MINIRSIIKLAENDGLTLKYGKPVAYKTGYQVATEGVECHTAREAINAVKAYGGNCGVWYSEEGVYYVDYSFRVATKAEALRIGRENNQICIMRWKDKGLIYC